MTTPKQKQFLSDLQANPITASLISRFQLQPTSQPEIKLSQQVSNRVNEIWEELNRKPVVLRSAKPNPFRSQESIDIHLTAIYGPKPWIYPLSRAPF